ncbi:MAG TPA: sigma 54-interacting transcriptional regulator [Polyangiaceae bacterium]
MPAAEHDPEDLSTLLTRRVDATPLAPIAFTLSVASGPDVGTSVLIDGARESRALLGTGPACALRLTDREVSRRHAAVDVEGQAMRLVDLGSSNGTWIQGVRVRDALLAGGEVVTLGATTLRVDAAPAEQPTVPAAIRFGRFVGGSTEMRRLYPLFERLARSSVPVIVEGETGTGKEVLAEALHEQGPRAAAPFVVFDCTQLTPTLVESELFGHERGAFTGAVGTRKGVFEQAHGGTLLVDEIGDLRPPLQAKLLRALERGEIRRVGGDRWIKVDVRIVAATRRDLDRAVQDGRFRDDLFHRLAVGRVELPPLRARRGDVGLLVAHFVRDLGGHAASVPNALLNQWEEHDWPGNVRELRNGVARYIALGELASQPTGDDETPPAAAPAAASASDFIEEVLAMKLPLATARERLIAEFERRYVERTLADAGGNVGRAAEASGVARRHFQRLKARSGR